MKNDQQTRPILIVEDNPVDLDLMRRALGKHNLTNPIEIARDGEEALAMLPRWESGEPLPVVILMDLKLPKYNGLEVLQRFREHPLSATVPVVVMTASDEDQDIQAAYALRANSYIVKPMNFDKFLEITSQIELYWTLINKLPEH